MVRKSSHRRTRNRCNSGTVVDWQRTSHLLSNRCSPRCMRVSLLASSSNAPLMQLVEREVGESAWVEAPE